MKNEKEFNVPTKEGIEINPNSKVITPSHGELAEMIMR